MKEKTIMVNRKLNGFTAVLLAVILCGSVCPINAAAAGRESADKPETVRIGFSSSEYDNYRMGREYEYFQNIAYRADFEYEYVYDNYSNLPNMLEKGELDILGSVSYTEERAQKFSFSDLPMGSENYYIFCRKGSKELEQGNLSALNGKTVGVVRESHREDMLKEWAEEKKLDLEIVSMENQAAITQALEIGELDAAAFSKATEIPNYVAAYLFGTSDVYFAVSKSRPDLLEKLNSALYAIQNEDPLYNSRLSAKYSENASQNIMLTSAEKAWIDSKSTIKVGCLNDYLPFSDIGEDGNVMGILPEVIGEILNSLGLKGTLSLEYKGYNSSAELTAAVNAGEIDVAYPIISDYYYAETNGMMMTTEFMSTALAIVHTHHGENVWKGKAERIAAARNNEMQSLFTQRHYPDSEIIEADTAEDCLRAIQNGKADCSVLILTRAQYYLSTSEYDDLHLAECAENAHLCLSVKRGENELLGILNKGIIAMGSSYVFSLINNSAMYSSHFSVRDYIEDNLAVFMAAATAVVLIVVAGASLVIFKTNKANAALRLAYDENQRAKKAAESANAAKTMFLFNMSHDLHTPMNAIMGYTDILEKETQDNPKWSSYLRKIKSSGQYMLDLANNVLEMSRVECDNIVLEDIPWSLERLNNSLNSVFADIIEKKKINFSQSADVSHSRFYCDPTRLKEVFMNIIVNALKYTPEGGRVSCAITELSSEEGYVTFSSVIEDNGIGISEEFLPHIFEPFSREKNSTESKVFGMGLGMSITKGLVEAMNGTITVESKKGAGTKVTVTTTHRIADKALPECAGEKAENSGFEASDGEIAEIPYARLKGKRILLAEDNELNSEIEREILTGVGFTVDAVENGLECVDMLKMSESGYYDVVLMDIQMPVMNGYEAARAIRGMNDAAKSQIPIFAITANAFEDDKQNAAAAGMNGHLSKPIDIQQLIGTLSAALIKA